MNRMIPLLLAPLLSGCWQSEADLYADETPVTPFKSGAIAVKNTDDPDVSHQRLTLIGKTYHVSGGKAGEIMAIRFHPLPGAPGYLVADVMGPQSCVEQSCEKGPHSYGLVHPLAEGRVEELAQNCDDDMASKVGAVQKGFVCEFSNRGALEKALRTLIPIKPVAVITAE